MQPYPLRRPLAALLLATALAVPGFATAQAPASPPAAAPAEPVPVPGTARLEGRILQSDGKTPEPGAIVRICSLDTEASVGSATADEKGEFRIAGLTHGFVEIVVTAGEQLFAANQVVQLAPAERKAFDFVLVPAQAPSDGSAANGPRPSPCGGQPSTGSAELRPKSTSGEFMRSKKGIAIVAGTGAAVLLLLTAGGGDDDASPSSP